METPTAPQSSIPPAKAASPRNYLVPVTILIGFLVAAITYRIITIERLEQSRGELVRYAETADGRDYASLIQDRRVISRVFEQSVKDTGRVPSQAEVEARVADIAQAGELASELDGQRARFTFFMDVIIYGLAGIIIVFLAALLFKRRHGYPR